MLFIVTAKCMFLLCAAGLLQSDADAKCATIFSFWWLKCAPSVSIVAFKVKEKGRTYFKTTASLHSIHIKDYMSLRRNVATVFYTNKLRIVKEKKKIHSSHAFQNWLQIFSSVKKNALLSFVHCRIDETCTKCKFAYA